MPFSPHIAEQRFGYGLSPKMRAPHNAQEMLDRLAGRDQMQERFGLTAYWYLQQQLVLYGRFSRFARQNPDTDAGKAALKKRQSVSAEVQEAHAEWFVQTQLRRVHTADAFRERLVAFWADHFTARGKRPLLRSATPLYIDEAVRPHVTGKFSDMLIACARHPLMLHYLDQEVSIGPNSRLSKRRDNGQGLNENLAREVMELHTLGVDGPYGQDDVRAFAALLTGLGRGSDFGFRFRPGVAEPGEQRVMGKLYSGRISMDRIETALQDLAVHPATAAHIARKIAVHFVADDPPPELVLALDQRFRETNGDLMALYDVLLNHPQAWQEPLTNIRPPDEFVSAALRSFAVSEAEMRQLGQKKIARFLLRPLKLMGQTWQSPNGPDGWAEADGAWVTPQGIAARLDWAMDMPKRILKDLPDPRAFVFQALGAEAPARAVFAAKSAENRAEAIGLVLMSPAFQRR